MSAEDRQGVITPLIWAAHACSVRAIAFCDRELFLFQIVARGAFAREMSTRSPVASWSRSLLPRNRGTFAPISQSSRNRSDKNASARFQTVDAARARRVRREDRKSTRLNSHHQLIS